MSAYGPWQFAAQFGSFLRKRDLQHLIVHVTNHCNFRCDHCFVDFTENKRDLSVQAYQKLSQQVGPLFWLDIAGGEPFLRKDLAQIVSAFDAKVVQIPSNASLSDQMLQQLAEMQERSKAEITISLSLDGLRETHDAIRKKPGNYDQVWDTFARLRQLGNISIKINSVLSAENAHQFLDLMRAVRANNPDFHSVILLRGDPLNPEFGLPPLPELRKMGQEIFSILESYNYGRNRLSAHLLRNYHRYLWNLSISTLEHKTQVIPCLAGQAHMVVWGDGQVSSCEMLPSVGNTNEQSWHQILQSDEYKKQLQSIRDKKCYCTHNCAMFDSIMFRPMSVPNLIHQKLSI